MMPGRRPVTEHRRLALANNRDRLAEVYRAYRLHTVRYIARRVEPQHSHAVEDLAQETFIRAWPELDEVEAGDWGSLHGWLSSIARYRVASYYRPDRPNAAKSHAAETPIATDSLLWRSHHVDTSVGADADAVEDRLDLQAALARLPAESRRVVEMRYLQDLTHAAVTKQLHCGKYKVDRLTREGLTALRGLLGDTAQRRVPDDAHADPMVRARQAVAEAHQRVAEGERRRDEETVHASGGEDTAGDPVARARSPVAQAHQRVAQGAARGAAGEVERAHVPARRHAEDPAAGHAADWGAQ